MSNDPKDAVVDLSKLVKRPAKSNTPTNVSPDNKVNTSMLRTKLDEGVNMIGRENFTKKDEKNEQ